MATSTITITDGASTITLDNTVSTLTLGTSGPQGAPGEGVPVGGTTGQILAKDSATNYDTSWIDNFTTDVRKLVKNDSGGTLAKGTVVYVSGANGTNVLVKPAIATADSTSATTIGILNETLAANASGYAIVEGTISGIDTSAATAGDPVWLSGTTAGGVLYGVANKPQAPIHIVYLGTVTRANVSNGQIEISVNNGWELDELHNVAITSPTNGQVLAYNSTTQLWENTSETGDISSVSVTSPITGGGTSGAVTIGFDQAAQNTTNDARYARLGAANAFTVGGHTITNTVAATVPLQILGAASQSANLQEWQNNSGSALTNIASNGGITASSYIRTTGGIVGGGSSILGSAGVTAYAASASSNGVIVRGAAAQTANLTEWQDSAGTSNAWIDSAGGGRFRRHAVNSTLTGGITSLITTLGTTEIGLAIKATASQTADLQQWQNSSGTVLAYVNSNGNIRGNILQTAGAGVDLRELSGGAGAVTMARSTAAAANPGANYGRIYFRDGTTAGTLKLVVRAGAAGAETTILDNIPQ